MGVDNDCDEVVDDGLDADGDGFSSCATADRELDCRDDDERINPGADELCDGIDNNCDGDIDGSMCVGCSDGARDELVDQATWPSVAACRGDFPRQSLRATRTGTRCGDDDGGECPTPEDLCAEGWHICMRDGMPGELATALRGYVCRALSEASGAAASHCSGDPDGDPRTTGCSQEPPYDCISDGYCSATVVCGPAEHTHCPHAVCPTQTLTFGLHRGLSNDRGCGNIGSGQSFVPHGTRITLVGVLCCADR